MKKFSKILSVALLVALVLSLGVASAFADDGYTITMNTTTGHTYKAYQVFAGDFDEASGKLSNINWGSGVNGPALLTALKADTSAYKNNFKDCTTAEDVAKVLGTFTNKGTDIAAIADIIGAQKTNAAATSVVANDKTITISGLADGYYLIVDETAETEMPEGNTYSDFMLEVVKDVAVTAKDSTTTSEKKVQDINDSEGTTLTNLQDSADYDIGDDVPYTLTVTLPSDYEKYTTYELSFHDDMCEALDYKTGSAMIKYGTADAVQFSDPSAGTAASSYSNGHVWVWTIANLKTAAPSLKAGDKVTITYKATLNNKATFGATGNENKMHAEFSNNPNGDQKGKTPDDINIVFTFKAVFDKYTTEGDVQKHLAGAEFALYKVVNTITDAQVAAFDSTKAETQALIVKSGYEAVVTAGQFEGEEEAVNGSVFTFNGIDDGTYVLVETKTPAGYNTISPIKFVVIATHDTESGNPKLTALTGNLETGIVDAAKTTAVSDGSNTNTANILNNSGTTLPSTGGIGTTIFYVVGGVLVLAAIILLVTKKRMSD